MFFNGDLRMNDPKKKLDETKLLMGALVRMKPKPHEALRKSGSKRQPWKN
jgi:hypothetical protein